MQTEEIINHIVNWLVDYNKKSGTTGFVIGVSGGIDSAVSSVLGAKTNLPILCVEMPIHQNLAQTQRARKQINWMKENCPKTCSKPRYQSINPTEKGGCSDWETSSINYYSIWVL